MSELVIIFLATRLHIFILLIGGTFALFISKSKRKKLFWVTAVTLPVSFLVSRIVSTFYYNPRPFVVDDSSSLLFHIADNGFPSDHMLLVSTIAVIVLMFNRPLGIILLVLSSLVGLGRVLSNVHHSIDILGSVVIATVAILVARVVTNKFFLEKYET